MAKVVSRRKKRGPRRGTNWLLIGGIVALGVIGLFVLLFATLQGEGVPTPTPEPVANLAQFCAANEDNCIEKGDPEAPVTVVEISDYGCSHCRNFNLGGTADSLDETYVEADQVQWIVVPYALRPATQPAAEAALCAAEQGEFFPYHKQLFELQGTDAAMSKEGFLPVAEEVGLDVEEFESCYDSGRYGSVVQRNVAVAASAGVSATPTFFINGRKVEGNLPLAAFQERIEVALGS